MPTTYQIDREAGLVSVKHSGRITLSECMRFINTLEDDPAYQESFVWLYDFREVTEFAISAAEARPLAGRLTLNVRHAYVTDSSLIRGLTRMLLGLVDADDPEQFSFFENMEEARAWLGLN